MVSAPGLQRAKHLHTFNYILLMNILKYSAAVLAATLLLAACSDDDPQAPVIDPPTFATGEGAYVLNQGSYYSGIAGTLDRISLWRGTYTPGVFAAVNGQSLGDSPQAGVVYGSRLYIAMYGSNLVWVVDKLTARIVKQIETREPEGICAAGGCVYVSNNDGYVTRIDTLSLAATGQIAVGPNPTHLTAAGDYLYVSVSDGYNSAGGYADGFRVAKVDIAGGAFRKVKDITVGMNPGPIEADSEGNVFVVCRGDYAVTKPAIQKITPDDAVTDFAPGSNIAVRGTTLYAVYNFTDWTTYESEITYKAYRTTDGALLDADLLPAGNRPASPIDIDVNPASGDLFIGTQPSAYDYTSPGYVYRYTSAGEFVCRYGAGVYPCAVIFY